MSHSISKGWERNNLSINFKSVTLMLITGKKSNNMECTVQKMSSFIMNVNHMGWYDTALTQYMYIIIFNVC